MSNSIWEACGGLTFIWVIGLSSQSNEFCRFDLGFRLDYNSVVKEECYNLISLYFPKISIFNLYPLA